VPVTPSTKNSFSQVALGTRSSRPNGEYLRLCFPTFLAPLFAFRTIKRLSSDGSVSDRSPSTTPFLPSKTIQRSSRNSLLLFLCCSPIRSVRCCRIACADCRSGGKRQWGATPTSWSVHPLENGQSAYRKLRLSNLLLQSSPTHRDIADTGFYLSQTLVSPSPSLPLDLLLARSVGGVHLASPGHQHFPDRILSHDDQPGAAASSRT
jgi:hypothetical protein